MPTRPSSKRNRSVRQAPAGRQTGRKHPFGLSVELSVHFADGFDRQNRRVRLAASIRAARSKGPGKALPGLKERETAAHRIAARCNPASLASLLAALAHPQRLAILLLLLPGEGTHKALTKATSLKAGPLYHHLRELRAAGLIGPKVRDIYQLTARGRRTLLATLAMEQLSH